jgi:subtilisin family serine protease
MGLSDIFYVKLHKAEDLAILENMAQDNNVTNLGNDELLPLSYLLSCTKESNGNAMQMANLFYESQLFASSQPDLIVEDTPLCVNDTYFGNQWGLNNTGQNGGISGIDIHFCEARTITKGNSAIIVAVLDNGVLLNHPDLTNMCPYSYDAESKTSPSQVYGYHGTACAGIIGATANNNMGVAGIAPSCPIMSISTNSTGTKADWQAKARGFIFARQNGASVISNSWSTPVPYIHYDEIDDAINDALSYGRHGLGCVVVFSSGNNSIGTVNYPSDLNDSILVVGAISPCGQRKTPNSCDGNIFWGSNYGAKLDIMAPGVFIPTTTETGGYMQNFNGTSAACPHVSGVAALVLSINPTLTGQQVRNIIESTAQKVRPDLYTYSTTPGHPNGTWNNEIGYGLVDAYAAVQNACSNIIIQNQAIYVNTTVNGCDNVSLKNVTVQSSSKLTVNAHGTVSIEGPFSIREGSQLEVNN